MKNEPEAHWLTQAEAADSLGISPRALRAWNVEPVAVIGRNHYFDGRVILQNRLEALKRKRKRPETTAAELKAQIEQLETTLTAARAQGQALRNSELRGELVQLAGLRDAIANACTAAGAALEVLPGALKRAVPTTTAQDLHEIRGIIARHQNQAAALTLQDHEPGAHDDEQQTP